MKTSAATEVEVLRAEVRQLRESVVELEDRLSQLNEEDEDPWGIWPYCWFISGWNFSRQSFHSFQGKLAKQALVWRNRRLQRAARKQNFAELHLT